MKRGHFRKVPVEVVSRGGQSEHKLVNTVQLVIGLGFESTMS